MIDAIDCSGAVGKIMAAARTRRSMAVSALAVHGVMTGVLDQEQRYRLNQLDLVVPDGQPVRWALNWLYQTQLPERVYGPKLMLKVCQQTAQEKLPIYLYGSQPLVLEALSYNLRQQFPDLVIAGSQPSRFRQTSLEEKKKIIEEIQASGAAITFVGLGCPRQEVWVYEYRGHLPMPLIAVGAAFDFHAGLLPQAPPSLQKLGLEWLFRLIHEPRRLWKRYLLLNPLYILLLILQILRVRRFDPTRTQAPVAEMRYG